MNVLTLQLMFVVYVHAYVIKVQAQCLGKHLTSVGCFVFLNENVMDFLLPINRYKACCGLEPMT